MCYREVRTVVVPSGQRRKQGWVRVSLRHRLGCGLGTGVPRRSQSTVFSDVVLYFSQQGLAGGELDERSEFILWNLSF